MPRGSWSLGRFYFPLEPFYHNSRSLVAFETEAEAAEDEGKAMVGIFSRISGGWGHRRAQSATDVRTSLAPIIEEVSAAHTAVSHGFEEAVEFKPVEHPSEPIVYDQPVACPLPEPSIINDGRIWKERRTSVTGRAKADLPVVKDASCLESRDGTKPMPKPAKRHISSSLSAPEHSIISLLEECNASQDQAGN